jgi:hypothetical protein
MNSQGSKKFLAGIHALPLRARYFFAFGIMTMAVIILLAGLGASFAARLSTIEVSPETRLARGLEKKGQEAFRHEASPLGPVNSIAESWKSLEKFFIPNGAEKKPSVPRRILAALHEGIMTVGGTATHAAGGLLEFMSDFFQ